LSVPAPGAYVCDNNIEVAVTIDEIAERAGGIGVLADMLGVHWSTVCGYKRTRRGLLPIHHARTVADVLDIPLWEIRPDVYRPPAAEERRHLVSA
jgi:hypothetical protein